MLIIQVTLSCFIMMLLDGLWLALVAKAHYYAAYSGMMRLEAGKLLPIWPAALMVYVLLVFGLNYYGLSHAKLSAGQAIWQSAIFGWVVLGLFVSMKLLMVFNGIFMVLNGLLMVVHGF